MSKKPSTMRTVDNRRTSNASIVMQVSFDNNSYTSAHELLQFFILIISLVYDN